MRTEDLINKMPKWLETGQVPKRATFNMRDSWDRRPDVDDHMHRASFVHKFGFCIPCAEALDACAKYAPLLEIGAGSGYWTRLLRTRGVDCIATDPVLAYKNLKHGEHVDTLPIQGKTAVRHWRDRNVLCVWPSYEHTWARQALKALRIGRVFITVTEGDGGCCADDGFFAILAQCFTQVDEIRLPVFYGLHDRMEIYRKIRPRRR